MAHPSATPVYYIFLEDERCLSWQAEFTNEYFERDDRKFTCLQWGTRHSAAPWLMPALGALEALRLPPPPPPPARQARVAERPEHMDTASRRNVHEVRDPPARQQPGAGGAARSDAPSVDRHGAATHIVHAPRDSRIPAGLTSRCPPSPAASICSAETQAFQRHTDEQREAQRQAHFQQGSPGAAGGWPW
ncbi:hypothetical protein CYMTET_54484 [Cymbomonas tetramitiformis]|uniref:Uncharacterized protein n=1 Tax=Cymbomonas tetramitiformis TaxID=36881 RepID=A0AAE0BGM2_9CHLO|nr:hypothetical protein CYMTET_54484 [Cymbomonas tetramitiformis]